MSRKVECPECGESIDIRGLSGHLQMGHGLSSDRISEITANLKTDNQRQAESDTAPDPAGDRDEAAARAARADGAGDSLSACENCGSADQVLTVRQMALEARREGRKLKPAVLEHDYFCSRCSVAFGGGANE